WGNGSPAADSFNVYRTFGTCAAAGSFSRIATGVGGTTHLDGGVSGGVTYAYEVTGRDATGACESVPSECVEATATGACTLPPTFAGLAAAASAGSSTCTVELSWAAASPPCGGVVTYNIYRSNTPSFTPSVANRIATAVTGTSFVDASPLHQGATYYYVVRAVDAGNGAEEANSVRRSTSPAGPFVAGLPGLETFEGGESGGGFDHPGWSHAPAVGAADWVWSATEFHESGTHSWHSPSQNDTASRVLTSPLFAALPGTRLTFWHTYDFEQLFYCFDGGTLEISTDGGTTWSVLADSAFREGGFNGTLLGLSPLQGRRGWCRGGLAPLTRVVADLSAYAGPATRLRWHAGEDYSIAYPGWYVDSVSIAGVCHAAPSPPMAFYTLSPCRLIDTRGANGPRGGPALQPGGQRSFALAGACDIPPTAKALSVNVTVTQSTAPGHLAIFAADLPVPPSTSAINFSSGQTRANNAIIALAGDGSGAITVQSAVAGTVHMI
ncbi:MAG: hypothetical protein ACREE7_12390, partial [Dongiaceae bacterium]